MKVMMNIYGDRSNKNLKSHTEMLNEHARTMMHQKANTNQNSPMAGHNLTVLQTKKERSERVDSRSNMRSNSHIEKKRDAFLENSPQ